MEELRKKFSLKTFGFPLKSQSNLTYYKTLKKGLELFEEKIYGLNRNDEISFKIRSEHKNIVASNKRILQIISSYLLGNSSDAYNVLEKLLESDFYSEKISHLIEKDNSFSSEESKLLRVC